MRTKSACLFKVAVFAIFFIWPAATFAANHIVINEFLPDPAGSNDTGKEWIKLYNPTDQTIDLAGWQLNGDGKYFTLPSFSLLPSSFLTVHWRADGQNSASEIFTGPTAIDANIGNSSGFIALFRSAEHNKDTIVDYLEYGKAGQSLEATAASALIWTKEQFLPAPGENQTLRLKQDGQDTNSVSDWEIHTLPSSSSSPSPQSPSATDIPAKSPSQSATSTQTPSSLPNFSNKILINEFMPWPESGNEWVELVSNDPQEIDLAGWEIKDSNASSSAQKIPSGTTIKPGQLLIIQLNKNVLNNDGDKVRLLWPDGQTIHSVSYQKAIKGQSCARFDGTWLWTNQPTPGQKNQMPIVQSAQPLNESSQPITLAAAMTESVSPISTNKNQLINNPPQNQTIQNLNTAQTIGSSSQPQIQLTDSPTVPPQENTQQKNSRANPLLTLGAVALLAALAAGGLIYFKRKTAAKK